MTVSVCIIVENLPVPIDRRVWKESCALRDAGYHVSVICPKGREQCSAAFECIDGIDIYRHSVWEGSGTMGYVLEYTAALFAELYLTVKVYFRRRFRILQACNPPDTIFLLALILKPFGVRFIFDHHDLTPELYEAKFRRTAGFFYRLTTFLERCSFRSAHVCIATNESFKEIAVARGGRSPEDVFVVRNCPDVTVLGPLGGRQALSFSNRFVVVYVGFMGSQDGLPILIEAIDQLIRIHKRSDVHFVLVGDGTELPMLKAMVADRGLTEVVTFTGRVPYEEVAAYLSTAHVGVAPDPKNPMNDKSTMIKILEYMAFGLPIVLFDLKEGKRIAGNGALYATPNEPADFARKIAYLLDSEEKRRELGDYGRKQIEERLNWNSEKAVFLQAYKRALQGGSLDIQTHTGHQPLPSNSSGRWW